MIIEGVFNIVLGPQKNMVPIKAIEIQQTLIDKLLKINDSTVGAYSYDEFDFDYTLYNFPLDKYKKNISKLLGHFDRMAQHKLLKSYSIMYYTDDNTPKESIIWPTK